LVTKSPGIGRMSVEKRTGSAHRVAYARVCDMCGRPLRSKRNLQERCGPWSGADMCAAFDAARTPQARMGVRRSGPIQAHALDARVAKLVFDPVSRPLRHPSPVTLPHLDSLAVVTAPTPPQPELDKPHPWPAAPRRSGPSCWPAPPAPASAACGRACAPATSQPERPCARPSAPLR